MAAQQLGRCLSGVIVLVLMTVATAACQSATTDSTSSPRSDRMGGTFRPYDCVSDEYVVQVASELSEQAYVDRVEQIRIAGQIPERTHYVTNADDCNTKSTQAYWILYSGPYQRMEQACPALLRSPPDSMILGMRTSVTDVDSLCLCATDMTALPELSDVGRANRGVGVVQRALTQVGFHLGERNVNSGGVFTPEMSVFVGKFQRIVGLNSTGLVDKGTWERLQVVVCGQH